MLMSYILPWLSEQSKQLLTFNREPWHPKWQAEKCTVQPWEAVWHLQLTEEKKLNKFLHTSHTERFRSFLGSGLWLHILCGYNPLWLRCRTVLASAGAGCKNSESDGEKSRWRQEWGVGDFPSSVKKQSCVEYQCTSSSFFLSAFYFLSLQLQRSPLAPPATRLSSLFSLHRPPSSCTFPLPSLACHLSSSSSPSFPPSVVVSLLLRFTPHRFPLARTLSCPPSGGVWWWQVEWMIDRARHFWSPPPFFTATHS